MNPSLAAILLDNDFSGTCLPGPNLKFDNQAGQIWARLASVKVRHALRFRKRVAIRILAPKIAVITRKAMYTENLGQ